MDDLLNFHNLFISFIFIFIACIFCVAVSMPFVKIGHEISISDCALFLAGDPESVAGEFGQHSLYKMLGYFSLIGLLRLHSLLGDYYQALKVLENIDFNKKVLQVSFMDSSDPGCFFKLCLFFYISSCFPLCAMFSSGPLKISAI